jgi:hypothetical protein
MVLPIHYEAGYNPLTLITPPQGLYCVAFAVHARIRGTNKGGGTNIAIYPLSVLFTLCTIFCAIDTAQTLFTVSIIWGPVSIQPKILFFSYVTKVQGILRLALRRST